MCLCMFIIVLLLVLHLYTNNNLNNCYLSLLLRSKQEAHIIVAVWLLRTCRDVYMLFQMVLCFRLMRLWSLRKMPKSLVFLPWLSGKSCKYEYLHIHQQCSQIYSLFPPPPCSAVYVIDAFLLFYFVGCGFRIKNWNRKSVAKSQCFKLYCVTG